MKSKALGDTVMVAYLNDLLQLDIDAVQAYGLVIAQLESNARKATVKRYQADHKRHVASLETLIRAHGGVPIPMSHIPTGPFKLAMQATASLGDDRSVLLLFKSNERQVRDKYRRAAKRNGLPDNVVRVIKRAAADEERHYRWVEKSLQQLGADSRTPIGRAANVMEIMSARTADVVEAAEKPILIAAEGARRALSAATKRPARTVAIATAVVGAAAAVALRRDR